MTRLMRLRARPILLAAAFLGLGCLLIALTGCEFVRSQAQTDGQQSLQTAFNAAKADEVTTDPALHAKHLVAIEENIVAAGSALGATVSTTGAAVTGVSP